MGFALVEESSGEEWVRGAVIGAGSFGTVSVAISKCDGNLFAVKSTHNSDSNSIQCLQNEHDILQSLDCPYIVRCLGHDFSRENGLPVFNLFMEYMPGGSVADLLNKFHGRFDESIIRSYTRSILHAIRYLHSQAIVHCDIKCSNILVAPCGIKIADFGSAKRTTDDTTATVPLRGTPLWMAPEVLNHLEQGPPSDIWSLGCTVLEMATGKAPWSHISHPLAAMYHIARTHDLPELPPCLSPQGRDFLEKCFRRDPKQRWTAAQLLNHPFLSNDLRPPQNQHVVAAPLSPTSILDYHGSSQQESDSHSSSFSNTVPILSLPAGIREGGCDSQKNRASEPCPRPSPKQRLLQLAADSEIERPNWFPSPTGQWIVVKSPQGESPLSAGPFSPLLNASFAQNLPEAECEVCSNATDTDVVDTRSPAVQVACLELKASIAQSQCGSLRRTGIPQLGSNLPNLRSVITARVDPARELCATSSVNLASDESASCILVTQGVDPRSFHDQLVSSSHKVAACSLCHRMCT